MASPRIAEEASATFVVNLPELGFGAHMKRIVTLLSQHGYRAIPMSKAYVLEMAEQVRQEIADENATARILEHAAANRPTEED
jgi:GTP cyclohydrolase FolE2